MSPELKRLNERGSFRHRVRRHGTQGVATPLQWQGVAQTSQAARGDSAYLARRAGFLGAFADTPLAPAFRLAGRPTGRPAGLD